MVEAAGAIQYYMLAAAVIPVLWVGNALQQLDPSPARHAIEPLDSRLGTLEDQSNTALRQTGRGHQTLTETLETLSSPSMSPDQKLVRLKELQQLEEARQAAVAKQKPIDTLLAEAASLKDSGRTVATRFRSVAMLSLVALPLAVLSEALSLYGVADDRQSTLITVTVTVGLALGGAILIVPLYAGWIRLMWGRSWLR